MVLTASEVHSRIRRSARWRYANGGFHLEFQAMATACRMSFTSPPEEGEAHIADVLNWVADFESDYSRFLPGSVVSRINRAAGADWVETDPQTDQLLHLCQELNFLTRGVFDPTALPLTKLWDWKNGVVPVESEVRRAMEWVGWRKVQRAPGKVFLPTAGMSIDLGGVGKEYAVDRVVQMTLSRGFANGVVDFGQDVFVFGDPPNDAPCWHVGLEDPMKPGTCWAGLGVRNAAVATSGDYVRCFNKDGKRFGHIIDVRTGQPVSNGCRAVSVVAPTCTLAGALSTAAFVLGPEEGLNILNSTHQVEGCLITDTSRFTSRRFHAYVVS